MNGASFPYRRDIDGLRAVAVLGVVAFHLDPAWLPGGFAGVDVFFVISGYLITALVAGRLAEGRFAFAGFYARRIRRLLPALVVVLATTLALGGFVLLGPEYVSLARHTAASAIFANNLALWSEAGYFDVASESKPLLHLWSLGVEEQFYLVWPAVLALLWRLPPALGMVGLAAIGVVSFAANVAWAGTAPSDVFYLPWFRIWEPALGAALAWTALRTRWLVALPPAWRHASSVVGLALVGVAFVRLDAGVAFPGWAGLAPTAGAALVIAAGPDAACNRWVLSRGWMVLVGLISYPLYLWHWPLLTLLRIPALGDPPLARELLIVAAAFGLAWLTYRFVEQPIRRAGAWPARLVPAPAALLAALGLVGGGAWAVQAGVVRLPSALPPDVQTLVDFGYRPEEAYREGRCYLTAEQPPEMLADECLPPRLDGRPLVLLWGDSHAAHLYPGLAEHAARGEFALAQVSAARCPPILGLRPDPLSPHCAEVIAVALDAARDQAPDVVLLAARWALYQLDGLDAAVAALRERTSARIVLVGPVPNWRDRLPRLLVSRFQAAPRDGIPGRMAEGLEAYLEGLDATLRERAATLGIEYLAPLDVLCTAAGCITKTGPGARDLVAWDESHLTVEGSRFLVDALLPGLLGPTAR